MLAPTLEAVKLRDDSFAQLRIPADEEKLLDKAHLFGYSYSC
jgi:hypothetical protein